MSGDEKDQPGPTVGADFSQMIAALSDPGAYEGPVENVEVRHTHISVVFLAGEFAYKVKKPLDLGFLDFSTLAKRRHFCEEEVRLNVRLAPGVYLGVVPITRTGDVFAVKGAGEVVEWAVKMQRLPDDATLLHRLQCEKLDAAVIESLARRTAEFHAGADRGERVAPFARFEVVARNARDNLTQATPFVGVTISPAVYDRLQVLIEDVLVQLCPLINDRVRRGVPRDTHGDLHLDHIYYFPGHPPPADLVIIDCIEFNERFRFADPVADIAFLVMDLTYRGRPDLAGVFAAAYFRASGDTEGRALLPFYVAYRAAVRAKVEGMKAAEPEVPTAERAAAQDGARGHWLLALGELEGPGRRPCLVLVAGLPGTGKSTLARGLADRAGFVVIRSDVVRKELAGLAVTAPAAAPIDAGLYSVAWTVQTYAECLRQAEALLFEGTRVVVDAGFVDERQRLAFLAAAARWSVPFLILVCEANPETVRRRLETRTGDASDADWKVYIHAAKHWEPIGPATHNLAISVTTGEHPDDAVATAMNALRSRGLLD